MTANLALLERWPSEKYHCINDGPPPGRKPIIARITLTLNPDELQYDEARGVCIFRPDGSVKRASYTTYILDLKSLEWVLGGGRPTAPVKVLVNLHESEQKTVAAEPGMAQPHGGFQNISHTGTVLGRVP